MSLSYFIAGCCVFGAVAGLVGFFADVCYQRIRERRFQVKHLEAELRKQQNREDFNPDISID